MAYIGQQLNTGRAEHFLYTATGGETSITTADDGRAIFYQPNFVDVYMNGIKLVSGVDFTATSGSSITGLAALTASDVIEIVAINLIGIADSVSASRGGTFSGAVTFDDTVTFNGNTAVVINGDLNVTGTTTTVNSATAQTVDLGDNDKIQLGDGNDLQLYHDGSNSIINDNGTGTLQFHTGGVKKFEVVSTGVYVANSAYGYVTTLSAHANNDVDIDLSYSNSYKVTMANNYVLTNPTNAQVGQTGSIFVTQDGTGGRTLSYGINWHWPTASAPTLSSAAGAVDRIDYVVYAANAVHAVATLDSRNS